MYPDIQLASARAISTTGRGELLKAIVNDKMELPAKMPADSRRHRLSAKLRIFLAREIFRQMVPVEKPSANLNEADMLLRRDLKLNYLAGLVSLTIDKDPSIFDTRRGFGRCAGRNRKGKSNTGTGEPVVVDRVAVVGYPLEVFLNRRSYV